MSKTAEDIFNFHWNLATGKQADETTRRHMTWVFNAMNELASLHSKGLQEMYAESCKQNDLLQEEIADLSARLKEAEKERDALKVLFNLRNEADKH